MFSIRLNSLFSVAISLLVISCDSPTSKPEEAFLTKIEKIEAPKEVAPIIEKLQKKLQQYKKPPISNLIIRYSTNKNFDYENEARGLCVRVPPTPLIYLFERDWIGKKAKSKKMQELSLIHLIGHCVYNLPHNDKTSSFKEQGKTYFHPYSVMHPNFNWNKFSPKFLEKNQDEYHEKLIDRFAGLDIN